MKKKINKYIDATLYTLGTLEKQVEKVEDDMALNLILQRIQELYVNLEDLTSFAYRNKKED